MALEPVRPRLATPAFVLITLATFAYFVAIGALLPTLPLYIVGPLNAGSLGVGLASGSLSLTALFLNLWAGRLGDRHGRRLIIIVGAVLAAVSTAGLLVAKSLPVLIALRMVTGAGEALFFVGAASAINDLAPDERRGEAVSLFSLALNSGLAMGPILGESVLAGSQFSSVWIVAAACAFVAAALATRVPDTRPAVAAGPSATHLVHPAAVIPGLILAAGAMGLAGFNAFVPLYALQRGLEGSRFVFFTFSAMVIAVRLFGARIPDRLGAVTCARVALLIEAIGLGTIAAVRIPAGLFVGTAVFALGHALLFPALLTMAIRRAPASERGAVVGTFTAFLDMGFALGPVGFGIVVRTYGYDALFATASGVVVAALFLLLRFGMGKTTATSEAG